MYPTTDDLRNMLREDQRLLEETLAEIKEKAATAKDSGKRKKPRATNRAETPSASGRATRE
jgi:hypothetical protein